MKNDYKNKNVKHKEIFKKTKKQIEKDIKFLEKMEQIKKNEDYRTKISSYDVEYIISLQRYLRKCQMYRRGSTEPSVSRQYNPAIFGMALDTAISILGLIPSGITVQEDDQTE